MSPSLTDFRTVGRTGLRVSPLALGTMTFGDPSWGADAVTSTEILARYLDAGGNFIDTANRYSEGASETVIGEYLAKKPHVRDRLVIKEVVNPSVPAMSSRRDVYVMPLIRSHRNFPNYLRIHLVDTHLGGFGAVRIRDVPGDRAR